MYHDLVKTRIEKYIGSLEYKEFELEDFDENAYSILSLDFNY
jgi:hypothetical protein